MLSNQGTCTKMSVEQVEMVETSTRNKNKQAFTTNSYSFQGNVDNYIFKATRKISNLRRGRQMKFLYVYTVPFLLLTVIKNAKVAL